jgi:glycosyltransferase involved in cell wall biosynthesis
MDPHRKYWALPPNRPVTKHLKGILRTLVESKLTIDNYPPRLVFQHAVCCSKYVRDTLVNSGHLPERAAVLYGGIDPQTFSPSPSSDSKQIGHPLQLLYFGRLVEQKGVASAIEALGILKERGFHTRVALTIVGSGHPGYEAKLKSMVDQLGIGDQVRFCGWVPRDDLPNLLKKFDIYLFTSVWPEPMARSVMEAMACGLLVVGSEVGGQTEMLEDGKNALTFKPNDAKGLSEQLVKIIERPDLRYELANKGRELVKKHFTLDRMIKEIEAYLHEIACQNDRL